MQTGISISLEPDYRRHLKALARNCNAPHKNVRPAELVLFSAVCAGTNELMRRTGKSKTCVQRWQEQIYTEVMTFSRANPAVGIQHHCARRDTHPDRADSKGNSQDFHNDGKSRRYQRQFHPTLLACARVTTESDVTVHALPRLALRRQVTQDRRPLSVRPPHAVVLSVDERCRIQVLDRTRPGLSMKKGGAGTMTRDYKRRGTTMLFVALNILNGSYAIVDN